MAWQNNVVADVIANIPSTGVDGALFFATDEAKIYRFDLATTTWVEVLAAGGGSGWDFVTANPYPTSGAGIWDHSSEGDTASPLEFTGLGAYTDILVLVSRLDKTVSSTLRMEVGHGAGPTWLNGSEYIIVSDAGGETTAANLSLNAGADTAPASGIVEIRCFDVAGPKPVLVPERDPEVAWYIDDTNALTAVRVQTSTGTGDFNGGAVYVYGKQA